MDLVCPKGCFPQSVTNFTRPMDCFGGPVLGAGPLPGGYILHGSVDHFYFALVVGARAEVEMVEMEEMEGWNRVFLANFVWTSTNCI